ncbi:hypothetical protein J6590_013354 [Homalodisca vitripennis]|nr:hypothetical protein J6590_013354 [Homalodisca vitripennis]
MTLGALPLCSALSSSYSWKRSLDKLPLYLVIRLLGVKPKKDQRLLNDDEDSWQAGAILLRLGVCSSPGGDRSGLLG